MKNILFGLIIAVFAEGTILVTTLIAGSKVHKTASNFTTINYFKNSPIGKCKNIFNGCEGEVDFTRLALR